MILNEWPDPQFCLQDANVVVTAMADELTGPITPINVSGHTTGSRNVVVSTTNTQELAVGDLIYFAPSTGPRPPAVDPALLKSALRITAVTANTSFAVTLEYKDGVPSTSSVCLAVIMQRGDTSGAAGGAVTSNVSKYPNSTKVWISERPAHTSLLVGCKRVLVVQKATGEGQPTQIFWQANAARLATMSGIPRAVGLAVYVANGSGATAKAWINAGGVASTGSSSATTATRTWISHHATPTGALYYAGVELTGPAGSTFVLGEFTEGVGNTNLADGAFYTPRAQTLLPVASISPWNSANVTTPATATADGTYSFAVDLKQASWGVINQGISYCTGLFEGQSSTVGNLFAWRRATSAPTTFSLVARAPKAATNVFVTAEFDAYGFCSGNLYLKDDATCVAYSVTASNAWGFCSFDLGAFVLFADPSMP